MPEAGFSDKLPVGLPTHFPYSNDVSVISILSWSCWPSPDQRPLSLGSIYERSFMKLEWLHIYIHTARTGTLICQSMLLYLSEAVRVRVPTEDARHPDDPPRRFTLRAYVRYPELRRGCPDDGNPQTARTPRTLGKPAL
jgi:hypothetical protein